MDGPASYWEPWTTAQNVHFSVPYGASVFSNDFGKGPGLGTSSWCDSYEEKSSMNGGPILMCVGVCMCVWVCICVRVYMYYLLFHMGMELYTRVVPLLILAFLSYCFLEFPVVLDLLLLFACFTSVWCRGNTSSHPCQRSSCLTSSCGFLFWCLFSLQRAVLS